MGTGTIEENIKPVDGNKKDSGRERKFPFRRRRKRGGAKGESVVPAAADVTDTKPVETPVQVDVGDVTKQAAGSGLEAASAGRGRSSQGRGASAKKEHATRSTPGRTSKKAKGRAANAGRSDDRSGGSGRADEALVSDSTPQSTVSSSADSNEEKKQPARRSRGRKSSGRPKQQSSRGPAGSDGRPTDTKSSAPRPRESRVDDTEPELEVDSSERQMLINVSAGDECRIAILHEGRLEELFIERTASQSHVGNIYKGRVTNVEPSIQAAFVDFGLPQNGFLHISDVQPQYFPDHDGDLEEVGRKIPRHQRPPIQKCYRRGQEVIVQVTKEGLGTKGPTLTTYLAIPGRFLVMMPGMNRHGVSRKIEDEEERRSMRDLMNQLELPTGMGFIMRTAGLGRTKRELQRDLHYLLRLWKTVVERTKKLAAPAELYQESDLVIRTIRDVYTTGFSRVITDDAATAAKAREFLQLAMPRSKVVVEHHTDRQPLFHRYNIEEEIEKINMRHVPLPSGGSLVIDSTEALVAIDVNSGKFRTTTDAEESAYAVNLEAAEEIARQLRLRDLGGLIVCDFIDMRLDRHKRSVERALRDALKKHKERARILRMSQFGLIEMTRQRRGPSLKRNIYYDCPHCKGSGLVKMPDSVVLDIMRVIQLAAHHPKVRKVTVTVAPEVAFQILNHRRAVISQIEKDTGKQVVIHSDAGYTSDQVEYACLDGRGRSIKAVPHIPESAIQDV